MDKTKSITVGKRLSYMLRHDITYIREKGWVKVDVVLDVLDISKTDLDFIVLNNNKKRYSYNDDKTSIRANQGHSIKVDVGLRAATPPNVLYHGTEPNVVELILKDGISKMNRQHVHLSKDIGTAVNVGRRHTKGKEPTILKIDSKLMCEEGFEFYLSVNKVWLADFIPPKYISILC